MAYRAFASTTINIGLLSVEVGLVTAVQIDEREADLVRLCECCNQPFHREPDACPAGNLIETKDRMGAGTTRAVKGVEVSPGQYVVIDADTLQTIEDNSKIERIDVQPGDVIDAADAPTEFAVGSYWLKPKKGHDKNFAVLHSALYESEKAIVTRFSPRSRQMLGVIRPVGDALLLQRVGFAPEQRQPDESLIANDSLVDDTTRGMMVQLLDAFTDEYDATKYRDEAVDEREKALAAVLKGKKVTPKKKADAPAPQGDTLSALTASLAQFGAAKKPAKRTGARGKRAA
jgi:DNA end-binding protein Ku